MSISFLTDISKLNCLDDLKSNDREPMSHQQHALRQISVDENGEIVIPKKYTDNDNEDECFYLYDYIIETKMQKIKSPLSYFVQ